MIESCSQMSEWRKIYETYEVSNYGEVISLHGGLRYLKKQHLGKRGYMVVDIHHNGKRKNVKVHRMVAEAFVLNPQNKPQVNHINGNKLDNRASNLEWCTCGENISHAIRNGLIEPRKQSRGQSKYTGVTWYKRNQKWGARIIINGKSNFLGLFEKELDARDAYLGALAQIT